MTFDFNINRFAVLSIAVSVKSDKRHGIYHSQAAYDGAEEEDHVLLDLLAPLQQDVEELNKAKGCQQETQHLNTDGWMEKLYSDLCQHLFLILGILLRKTNYIFLNYLRSLTILELHRQDVRMRPWS